MLDIQNTRSMSHGLEPTPEFSLMDRSRKGVSALIVLSGENFLKLVDYPVMVECWRHKDFGRVKKAWLSTFTDAERAKIGRQYAKFYKWHLVSGTPRHVALQAGTINLLLRAVAFFASAGGVQ